MRFVCWGVVLLSPEGRIGERSLENKRLLLYPAAANWARPKAALLLSSRHPVQHRKDSCGRACGGGGEGGRGRRTTCGSSGDRAGSTGGGWDNEGVCDSIGVLVGELFGELGGVLFGVLVVLFGVLVGVTVGVEARRASGEISSGAPGIISAPKS